MAVRGLQAFERTVKVQWPALVESDTKKYLVLVARREHEKIVATAVRRTGFPPQWEAYANTPGQTNLDAVKLPGPIVYLYRYATEIVEIALTMLQRISPVRSGLYAKSHTIYVDGNPVSRAPINMTHEVVISNPVPYARKIEIGKTRSGRPFVIQVPNRIYERTAQALRGRYRQVATVTFTYMAIAGHARWPAIKIGPPKVGAI